MIEKQRHALVWQECGPHSEIAVRFFVPDFEGYLPFFIWGEELDALENKERVELREELLLKGILYGLYEFDHHPNPWVQKRNRETFLFILDRLTKGFGYDDPEKIVLDTAANVRDLNGNAASRIILETGRDLLPQSAKIKSDLVYDLWCVISEAEEQSELLMEVINLVEHTDLGAIPFQTKEILCYYGLCATVFLGRESEAWLEKFIYPNITFSGLKNRIYSLLENPENFTPADMLLI